jgi:3-ketosteroid 9alpha-monooxygenase subunit B
MALSPDADLAPHLTRDHGFHMVRVREVVRETDDASSFVLGVPPDLIDGYSYRPGQFLTFRCWIDGEPHLRCYSMSSSPDIDDQLQVTVKRVTGGIVSNWMIDGLGPGDEIETTLPSGVFGSRVNDGDVVAFAGGSGITPILSIAKSVLAVGAHRVRLFYANRDAGSVIFESALDSLRQRYGRRIEFVQHLDTDRGVVDADEVTAFAGDCHGVDCFICGPGPFMDLVEKTLLVQGADPGSVHIERFTPAGGSTPSRNGVLRERPPDENRPGQVTIELDGRVEVGGNHPGATILQIARQLGMSPPYSCEAGSCATCMARIVEGDVSMYANNALSDEEVADGWILTCQAVPSTPTVRVVYGWGEG